MERRESFIRIFYLLVAAWWLAVFGLGSYYVFGKPQRITVVYTSNLRGVLLPNGINDTLGDAHGKVTDFSSLQMVLEHERTEGQKNQQVCLTVDGGDFMAGPALQTGEHSMNAMLELMHALPYDALAPGTEEMDLAETLPNLPAVGSVKWLASNADIEGLRGPPELKRRLLDIRGLKIALLSYYEPPTAMLLRDDNPYPGVTLQRTEAINQSIQDAHADVVILMASADDYPALAAKVTGVDMIVPCRASATAPTDLPRPVGTASIVPWVDGRFNVGVSVLHLRTAVGTRQVESKKAHIKLRPAEEFDESRMPAAWKQYQNFLQLTYGESFPNYFAKAVACGHPGMQHDFDKTTGWHETPVGDYVADAVRKATGAELCVLNHLAIRHDLKDALILKDVHDAQPYHNELVTLDLTGAQISQVLKRNSYENPRFLQLSGAQLYYDRAAPGAVEIRIGGQPLDMNRTYRVVTNDYLARGGRTKQPIFTQGQNMLFTGTYCQFVLLDALGDQLYLSAPGQRMFRTRSHQDEHAKKQIEKGQADWKEGKAVEAVVALSDARVTAPWSDAPLEEGVLPGAPMWVHDAIQGRYLLRTGDLMGAAISLARALRARPDVKLLSRALGAARFQLQDWPGALQVLPKDSDPEARSMRAACYLRLGQPQAALQELDGMNGDSFLPVYFLRGISHARLAKVKEALDDWAGFNEQLKTERKGF